MQTFKHLICQIINIVQAYHKLIVDVNDDFNEEIPVII